MSLLFYINIWDLQLANGITDSCGNLSGGNCSVVLKVIFLMLCFTSLNFFVVVDKSGFKLS